MDDTDDTGETVYIRLGDVEGIIECVVRDSQERVGILAWFESLDNHTVVTGGDEVGFVPLDEPGIVDDGASDDIAGEEPGHH